MNGTFGKQHISHADAPALYSYHNGPEYEPQGATKSVFNMLFQLPTLSFRGAARRAGALNVFQAKQAAYNNSVPVSGLGGTQAGFIVQQPLVYDPDVSGSAF